MLNNQEQNKGLNIIRNLWLVPVYIYQKLISPLLGPNCRYSPTCSSYMVQAVKKHGILKGTILGTCRIIRCNSLFIGGEDPVPETFSFKQIKIDYKNFRQK